MKILAINGSHRGNKGFTSFCISKIFEGARNEGAECEEISLAEKVIHPCTGCQVCHSSQHYLRCIYEEKDDVQMIFDKMKAADIIIYATPVYIFAMSGLLKLFLDRLNSTSDSGKFSISKSGLFFHHVDPSICSKPFVTLVCCDNLEDETTKNVVEYFKTFSRFMDARQAGMLVRKSGRLFSHRKTSDKDSQFPKTLDVCKAFVDAGMELAANGRISTSTQKRTNQNVLPIPPFVQLFRRLRKRYSKR